jgi:hypothetical protein
MPSKRRVHSQTRLPRFAVFGFGDHYPSGGWGDFVGASQSITGAKRIAQRSDRKMFRDNWEIVDLMFGDPLDLSTTEILGKSRG